MRPSSSCSPPAKPLPRFGTTRHSHPGLAEILEEIFVHKPCGDAITPSKRFNATCGATASVRFDGRDQPRALEPCQLSRMAISLHHRKGLDWRRHTGVIAEHAD